MFQYKCNERQKRANHERDYWKYISTFRQPSFHRNISYLALEYSRDIERSRLRTFRHRQNQYEHIQRENDRLTKHISQARGQLMTKEQCEKDWQRHIHVMKQTCDYPENIDRFVSNQQRKKSSFTKVRR